MLYASSKQSNKILEYYEKNFIISSVVAVLAIANFVLCFSSHSSSVDICLASLESYAQVPGENPRTGTGQPASSASLLRSETTTSTSSNTNSSSNQEKVDASGKILGVGTSGQYTRNDGNQGTNTSTSTTVVNYYVIPCVGSDPSNCTWTYFSGN